MLFVCTGNVCRSPMAHLLTQSELRQRFGSEADDFRLLGAGTGTREGYPISPHSVTVLREYEVGGPQVEGYQASEITPKTIASADLVLAAERTHRSAVVDAEPTALKRAFTLLEFARIAATVSRDIEPPSDLTERARLVVTEVARRRASIRPARAEDDDIADPIGHPLEVFRTVGRQIAEAVDDSLTALVGFPVQGTHGAPRRARGA